MLVSLVTRWLCIGPSWTNTLVHDTPRIATSHTPTSPPPVSSMTWTKKTLHPPYKQFHMLVPPFTHHLAGCRQPSPSQMTLPPTKPSWPPSPEYKTTSTMVTHMSGRSKRSFKSLTLSNTKGQPAKMTKPQHSSRDSTKLDDWNLDLSHLPLRHQHPLTSPFRHLPFQETCKSWRVPWPPVPKSTLWPADRLRPSNLIPEVPGVWGLKLTTWEEEYHLFQRGFASELSCCLLTRQEELRRHLT